MDGRRGKKMAVVCAIFCFFSFFYNSLWAQEVMRLGIYNPVPFGNYLQLRSRKAAAGSSFSDRESFPWDTDGVLSSNEIPSNADLVVEGNVGIGTYQPGIASVGRELTVTSSGSLAGLALQGDDSDAGDSFARISFANARVESASIRGLAGTSQDSGHLAFFTKQNSVLSERMRITEDGNVGVGTLTPEITAPGGGNTANLTLNDVFISSIGRWGSQPPGGAAGFQVFPYNGNGAALGSAIESPVFVFDMAKSPHGHDYNSYFFRTGKTPFTNLSMGFSLATNASQKKCLGGKSGPESNKVFGTRATVRGSGIDDVYFFTIGR